MSNLLTLHRAFVMGNASFEAAYNAEQANAFMRVRRILRQLREARAGLTSALPLTRCTGDRMREST